MRNIRLLSIIIIYMTIISAQVFAQNLGIGPDTFDPDASAGVEMRFTNKGLLIPRVALTSTSSASPITSPATSLLIYNTATAGDVTPGYYYWNGSKWMRLLAIDDKPAWLLSGNAATTPGTNFIGTTDAKDLVFKTNSAEIMRITSAGNVGIGPDIFDPDASAGVEMRFSNKGLLIPRVALTSTSSPSPITSPANSLLIYNTATTGDVTPGYYYWTGSKWMRLLAIDDKPAWLLSGNAGTTPGTNFIGTTDAQDLVFKTNSTEKMRITSSGNVGIGTGSPSGKLNINEGDIIFTYGTNYGTWRYGAKFSVLSGLKGRQINNNPDFLEGISTYNTYDNGNSGSITRSIVDDATAPNASGRVMKIDHSNVGSPSPGWGGFYKAFSICSDVTVGQCYREGDRIIYRIWAKIPEGYLINFASNAYGNGGNYQWISSQSGTDNWEEYIAVQTIGSGGSFSSTGFWYISGGARPFTWYVASVEIIDIDQIADVDRSSELNVGYKKDISLGTGNLLTTQATYLATDGGNVGIGTTSPSAKLHVAGNIKTNTINETSDERFKKNIQNIDTPLSKVLSLRGVYYYWDLDNPDVQEIDSSKQIGMIAQEVEKILPELVNTDSNGYKSVEYSRVVAVLIEAMKEQQKTIDEQKDMINDLNERITKLEELIKVK